MKKFITIIFLFSTALLISNCNLTQGPTHGGFFTSTTFPGTFNLSNDVKTQKTAEGCQYTILGLFAFGDAGAGQIAKANGISRIATVDYKTMSILTTIFHKYCTVVSGESK